MNETINWPFTIKESKYSLWYTELIYKAKNRTLPDDVYVERHHIIPRCMTNDHSKENLVTLTAREHYIAHALLWKMVMPAKWHNKMMMALHMMVNGSGNKKQDRSYRINSRIYEANRIAWCKYLSESMKGENNSFYGKKHTEETKEKISEANKRTRKLRPELIFSGEKNGMYGKTHTLEYKKQMSEISKKLWSDTEANEKRTQQQIESWKDPERRKKQGQRRIDYWKNLSPEKKAEIIEKGAAKHRGKKLSEETKRKISEKLKGRKQSEEVLAAGKITREKYKKECEYCGKIFAIPNYTQWHGKNCKAREGAEINTTKRRKNRVISEDGKKRMAAARARGCRAPMPEHVKKQIGNRFRGRTDTRGELNGNFGKKMSEETKRKISEKLKGRKHTEEHLIATQIAREKHKKQCEYCGMIVTNSNYTRWHGKNCKKFSN